MYTQTHRYGNKPLIYTVEKLILVDNTSLEQLRYVEDSLNLSFSLLCPFCFVLFASESLVIVPLHFEQLLEVNFAVDNSL